jgi:lysozyme
MKKSSNFFLLFLVFCSLLGSCGKDAATKDREVPTSDTVFVMPALERMDTATIAKRKRLIAQELKYYLERHDVQDDGYDMVARYASMGDSTLLLYRPTPRLHPFSIGRWRQRQLNGTKLLRDAEGRMIIGAFEADTLVCGIRIDSAGIYAGQFSRHLQATGHGSYRLLSDGSFYEGHWLYDRRDGYGFLVTTHNLQAGQWQRGRFRGERVSHTPNRIYGIDISRYQHEKKRRRYHIDWRRLRVKGLGHRISQQQVNGKVDYPVTFVYIKCTEGISINNRYYIVDNHAAHRNGYKVGAYHFFSTRQSASAQATYFLNHARIQRGDLPPMLDVEPSDALIRQMGGPDALMAAIRQWLTIVERRVGVRPLLYVSQRFVNNYLINYPDLKNNYQIWIARYGEYKPDVHLAIWQLSADGHVSGITPEVDINVFNGYQGQWEEFLRDNCVR